jgi:hypothetical protein
MNRNLEPLVKQALSARNDVLELPNDAKMFARLRHAEKQLALHLLVGDYGNAPWVIEHNDITLIVASRYSESVGYALPDVTYTHTIRIADIPLKLPTQKLTVVGGDKS